MAVVSKPTKTATTSSQRSITRTTTSSGAQESTKELLERPPTPRFSYTKRLAVESDAWSTIRRPGRSSRPEFRTLTLGGPGTALCARARIVAFYRARLVDQPQLGKLSAAILGMNYRARCSGGPDKVEHPSFGWKQAQTTSSVSSWTAASGQVTTMPTPT